MNQLRQEIKELVTTLIINESDVKPIEMSHTQLFEHVKKFCADNFLRIGAEYYGEDIRHYNELVLNFVNLCYTDLLSYDRRLTHDQFSRSQG